MNPFHASLLSGIKQEVQTSQVLSISQVTEDSAYWLDIHKSSEWSDIFTLTKDYFVLYSTVHGAGTAEDGGLWWGEMDDPQFNGFIERGLITSGFQSETPTLIRRNNQAYIFYHTLNEPGNGTGDGLSNIQETRLIRTDGGAEIHNCTYTDLGRPLGLLSDENHTGYLWIYERGANDYIGYHLARSGETPTGSLAKWSTSSDLINWTRQGAIDRTAGAEPGGDVHPLNFRPFDFNGNKYAFAKYTDAQSISWVALVKTDNDGLPNEFLDKVYQFDNLNNVMLYKEGSDAFVSFSTANVAPTEPYFQFKYNLIEIPG